MQHSSSKTTEVQYKVPTEQVRPSIRPDRPYGSSDDPTNIACARSFRAGAHCRAEVNTRNAYYESFFLFFSISLSLPLPLSLSLKNAGRCGGWVLTGFWFSLWRKYWSKKKLRSLVTLVKLSSRLLANIARVWLFYSAHVR